MATRALIAYIENDKCHVAYCHNDGYPSHLGWILFNEFTNKKKLENLVFEGGFSALDLCWKDDKRDEDEVQVAICKGNIEDSETVYKSLDELLEVFYDKKYSDTEYLYVFDSNKWYYYVKEDSISREKNELSKSGYVKKEYNFKVYDKQYLIDRNNGKEVFCFDGNKIEEVEL